MKTNVYNQNGEKVREITLPENVFGLPWNSDIVHQVLVSLQSNMRTVIAHTKDRGDVRGGGIKPWRQKGTGRARHGSRRSPLWRGGGVTFGPTNERNFAKKINKKMRAKALYVLLSRKFKSGEVIFVDSLSFSEPKSSGAKTIIEALARSTEHPDLATKRKNAIFLALGKRDDIVKKSFNNFGNVALDEVRNLNALDIATSKYVIITHPEESIEFLSKRQSPSELILAEAGARA